MKKENIQYLPKKALEARIEWERIPLTSHQILTIAKSLIRYQRSFYPRVRTSLQLRWKESRNDYYWAKVRVGQRMESQPKIRGIAICSMDTPTWRRLIWALREAREYAVLGEIFDWFEARYSRKSLEGKGKAGDWFEDLRLEEQVYDGPGDKQALEYEMENRGENFPFVRNGQIAERVFY